MRRAVSSLRRVFVLNRATPESAERLMVAGGMEGGGTLREPCSGRKGI